VTLTSHLYTASSDSGSLFIFATLSGIKSTTNEWTERFNSYIDAFGKLLPAKLAGKVSSARLNYEKELKLKGHMGREYNLIAGELSGPVRFYITRKKFYALAVLSGKTKEPLSARFLDSLSLPERAVEPAVSQAAESPKAARWRRRLAGAEAETTTETEASAGTGRGAGETAVDSTDPTKSEAPLEGGVVNDKATSLPKPESPQDASSGAVTVQVLIDEQGNVIEARAVTGARQFRAAAEAAARRAKVSPTKLSGVPRKVRGVIIYDFASG
jgi:TonB family protein